MFPDFSTTMVLFRLFIELMQDIPKSIFSRKKKAIFDILIQGSLIVFERQGVVSLLLDDLSRNGSLCSHGINRDDTPFKNEKLQEFRNGGNLIGFLIHRNLREHHPVFTGPSDGHMERFFPVGSVMGAPQRLSIDGNDPSDFFVDALYPCQKTGFKLLGIDACKNTAKGIM